MVDSISRVGNSSHISPISRSNINSANGFSGIGGASYHEKFHFPDDEKIMDMGKDTLQDTTAERKNKAILIKLLRAIITDGIIVVPTPPRKSNNAVIEASLVQDPKGKKPPIMKIPLRGVANDSLHIKQTAEKSISIDNLVENYVDRILLKTSDTQITRLIIIMAHEYGHFLSYLIGNHNRELKLALNLFAMKQFGVQEVNRYLWLIFREESSAWHFARKTLTAYGFDDWSNFTMIKDNSLSSYAKLLHLQYSNNDTMWKLAYLGEDFHHNFPSDLFPQANHQQSNSQKII